MDFQQKRLSINSYSITSDWLIGFTEAEGGFYCNKREQPMFQIYQHVSDWVLLEAIASFLTVGKIRDDGRNTAVLTVQNKEALAEIVIPLFQNKLLSRKKNQFNEWTQRHFNLKTISNHVMPINSQWLVGFTDGDGAFFPTFHKQKDYACGYQVRVCFDLAQESVDKALLNQIGQQFFYDKFYWARSKNVEHLRINSLETLLSCVEPFYIQNSLQSRKRIDFLLWQEILRMMERKEHRTLEGLQKIRQIRDQQRRFRVEVPDLILEKIKSFSFRNKRVKKT